VNTPVSILKQYWGFDAFRPLQEDIIQSVLDGHDTLALLPTGGGKSICYQVPAMCKDGLCIVVSPLIALMKDQVQNLKKRGIPAAAIVSGMNRREIDVVFENACQGAYKLLYVSPERLQTDMAQVRLQRMNINLLAVDEAHCVSQWGYDFRPPYLQIAELRELLPGVPVLALTATATPEVADDIQEKLAFRIPKLFQQSFLRSNLSYSVLYESKKIEKLVDILQKVPGSGIVYVRSRGETKSIADLLVSKGVVAGYYHAGLSSEERNKRQEAWMDGKMRVMVCTNAFGMGIDKPDVRIVVHLMLPDSLEAYFQEAGRAGRDGKKSYAVLLYMSADADQLKRFFDNAYPPFGVVRRVYLALGSYTQAAIGSGRGESYDFDLQYFSQTYKIEQPVAHAALKLLEQEGWLFLSEAFSAPAQVKISASREVLYDYQIRNKQADAVIKSVLRLYPGIQREMVDISEQSVGNLAKMATEAVVKILETGEKEGILWYQPKHEKPQIVFTRERTAAENLTIDFEKFNFRRANAATRIEKAILFAEQKRCRSQQLLAYFGEKNAGPCGICDICTGRNESNLSTETVALYEKKIKEVLRREPLSLEEILQAFAMKKQETVAKVLQFLTEEGILEEDEEGRILVVSG
jgi:ATP-dependent DNA helicase RecQ